MSSTYRSAMGKPVDMAAIRTRNENVRAVGNMSVNARGDEINSNNEVVTRANQRVNRAYSRTTVNPTAQARQSAPQPQRPVPSQPVIEEQEPIELSAAELELEQELEDEIIPEKSKAKVKK